MKTATQGRAVSWLAAVLILGLFLGVRSTHRDLERPLVWDELTTLRYFTWAGVESSGEPRVLDRIDDIRNLDRPSPRELGIGLYCSLGRWPEPGNHVVHSLLANFTLGLLGPGEPGLRFAALIGALAFGLALYWLLAETLRWKYAAPAALVLALWNPFVWRYSATARGYSWLFALQLLLLILLLRLPHRTTAIVATGMAVMTAVLCLMNHITMAVYWVFPVYLAFWLLAPDEQGRAGVLTGGERSAWRRNLRVQALIVAALAALFVVDRLPYIYASSGGADLEPGVGVPRFSAFAEGLGSILFPGAVWKVVAISGLAGLLLAPRRSARRTILAVAGLGAGVSVAHFIFSGWIPPPRVLAWMIPVVLIGFAGGVEGLVHRLPDGRSQVWAALGFLVMASVLAVVGFRGLAPDDPVESLAEILNGKAPPEEEPTLMLLDKRVGPVLPLYLPGSWRQVQKPPPEGLAHLVLILRPTNTYGRQLATRNQVHEVDPWEPLTWPTMIDLDVGDTYRVLESRGRVVRFPARIESSRALVFWYPAVESVAVRPQKVLQHLSGFSLRYMPIKVPFPAKLEVFFRLGCLVFPADSRAELDQIELAVSAGLESFGGEAKVFIPDSP